LRGTASGVLNTGAQLGTALGVAGLLVLSVTIDRPWPGTALAWAVAAIIAGLAALALVAGDVAGRTPQASEMSGGNWRGRLVRIGPGTRRRTEPSRCAQDKVATELRQPTVSS
jgi:hypothetical protein